MIKAVTGDNKDSELTVRVKIILRAINPCIDEVDFSLKEYEDRCLSLKAE